MNGIEYISNHKDTKAQSNTKHEPLSLREEEIGKKMICELKAVDEMNTVYKAQLLSHMKLMKKRLGYLINFNVAVIKNGIDRVIL